MRQAAKYAYPTIDEENISMNVISARDGILPEVGKKLGEEAMKYLEKVGVTVFTNTKATDASEDSITLDNGEV